MSKTCNNCGTDKKPSTVPYAVLEDFKETAKANSLKWFIAVIVLIALLVGSNMAWLYAWNSYDYVSEEYVYSQDGQGTNIIGDGNDVDNGAEVDNSQKEAH